MTLTTETGTIPVIQCKSITRSPQVEGSVSSPFIYYKPGITFRNFHEFSITFHKADFMAANVGINLSVTGYVLNSSPVTDIATELSLGIQSQLKIAENQLTQENFTKKKVKKFFNNFLVTLLLIDFFSSFCTTWITTYYKCLLFVNYW